MKSTRGRITARSMRDCIIADKNHNAMTIDRFVDLEHEKANSPSDFVLLVIRAERALKGDLWVV